MAERPNEKLKVPPEDIELRVKPRPVSRINRKALIGGTAIVSIILMGAVISFFIRLVKFGEYGLTFQIAIFIASIVFISGMWES